MAFPYASDKSNRTPRMEIFQSVWAMRDLTVSGEPFDLARAVEWMQGNGFTGVMPWVASEDDFAAVDVIRRAGLLIGVGFPALDLDRKSVV